jgi:hypothetical protein
VPGGGVEPPRPEGHQILSLARLPVPPSRRAPQSMRAVQAGQAHLVQRAGPRGSPARLQAPLGALTMSALARYGVTTRGCSSVGRARGWQSRGQGFKSPQLHHLTLTDTARGGREHGRIACRVRFSIRIPARTLRTARRSAAVAWRPPVPGGAAHGLEDAVPDGFQPSAWGNPAREAGGETRARRGPVRGFLGTPGRRVPHQPLDERSERPRYVGVGHLHRVLAAPILDDQPVVGHVRS